MLSVRQECSADGSDGSSWRGVEGIAIRRPIKALADKLGYESAAAFSAMFKKYMGQPPPRDLSTVRFSAKIGE